MSIYSFIDNLMKEEKKNQEDEKSSISIIKSYRDQFSNTFIKPNKRVHNPNCRCTNCNFNFIKDTKPFDDVYKEDIKE